MTIPQPPATIPPQTQQALRPKVLTSRELTVLKLMADGLSTKEISRALGVSFKTAATHRVHILGKLGVHETVSAVRWAIRAGLIEP
jgi:DNA-binding NarL/FixJ family response regulator